MPKREIKIERVYEHIKMLIKNGAYLPGEHVDIDALKDQLGVSIQPVRTALYMLAREGFIEAFPNEGFRSARITEPDLEDLYTVHVYHVDLSIKLIASSGLVIAQAPALLPTTGGAADIDLVAATEHLFSSIALASGNTSLKHYVANEIDRLHAVRKLKGQLLPDWSSEYDEMASAWLRADYQDFRRLLNEYRQVRKNIASRLVRLLHQRT
ncbi:hypothetical protein GCM10011273_18270 [Asticcacaulis endophyticus]|uniref:HTH gntR-type domain-containing protein n=2 Tax=Asticcacaulis endophyticus TaxID=1395890 RepID=A0A918UTB6_9CAUL|nr:hypothetical protein GCM10011273_18270 [Asticcacaulis endophyticus]